MQVNLGIQIEQDSANTIHEYNQSEHTLTLSNDCDSGMLKLCLHNPERVVCIRKADLTRAVDILRG